MNLLRRLQVVCAAAALALLLPSPVFWSSSPFRVAAVAIIDNNDDDTSFSSYPFVNLVQLTEAVLAPAWSTGGYAYVLNGVYVNNTGSPRPVCLHTRTSPSLATAPFTFAMFDTQFSPLYSMAADNTSASAIGQLDLQRDCYVSLTSSRECTAVFVSHDGQCLYGSEDALNYNWTVDAFKQKKNIVEELGQITPLPASGLTAAELFTVFVNDYLPQRAWLRTAVPQSLDLLYSAAQSARVFRTSTSDLSDVDEVADMQRAITTQWNGYLWNVYGPQLRRKWDLLHSLAESTLTKGGLAPSLHPTASANNAGDSITGIPGSVGTTATTSCPLMDVWLQLRYKPDDISVAQLVQFMEAAVQRLADSLAAIRERADTVDAVAQTDALLFDLVRSVYCMTITNLFSLTALLDRPFLQAITSVWIEAANHSDSWAWQTMQAALVSEEVGNASAFQSAASTQVSSLISLLSSPAERSLLSCLAGFLDPAMPLTSSTLVSPSDCVRQFLEARDRSISIAENFTVLFDVNTLRGVSVTGSVPGITRYESTLALPSVNKSAADGVLLRWFLMQESSQTLTAQTSIFTPSVESTSPTDACATAAESGVPTSNGDWTYECAAGTYVFEANASCAVCPSACAAAATSAFPVYCPGDGLLHGCPPRPTDAVYVGSTNGGHTNPAAICRYTCANVYTAPMNYSCLSVSGMYYNTSATGNVDLLNGGGLSSCLGPTSLFPAAAPVVSQTRMYTLVGSGATNDAYSCPFTLLHRATTSAVARSALEVTGAVPPLPFFRPAVTSAAPFSNSTCSATASPASSLLVPHSAVTWEVEVQLNATQLYAMHVALRQSLREQGTENEGSITETTTIAHELFGVQKMAPEVSGSPVHGAERVLSWYLVSTLSHTGINNSASAATTNTVPSPASTAVRLQLLLNLTVACAAALPSTAAAASSATVDATNNLTSTISPAPSSLVVLGPTWSWYPWSVGSNSTSPSLITSVYRVVLNRQTNTVSFSVSGGASPAYTPAVVDWPLWVSTATTSISSSSSNTTTATATSSPNSPFFLSVGGWVGRYKSAHQWIVKSNAPTSTSATVVTSTTVVLPLYYDYVPGMVTRLSAAASLISAFQDSLRAAEITWQVEAAAEAAAQGQQVAQLTSLTNLAHYVAPTPLVMSNISAILAALALRTAKGLNGVCRPGYGVLPTSLTNSSCETCMSSSYTVMNAAEGSNRCACTPQRVRAVTTYASASRTVSICKSRSAGPGAPQKNLSALSTLYVDGHMMAPKNAMAAAAAASIPLGWYAAAATGTANDDGDAAVKTTSLCASVVCTYGLTSPVTVRATTNGSASADLNTSVALQYTTGLGGEACGTMAAARGGSVTSVSSSSLISADDAVAGMTKPTYTDVRLYSVRLRAPALTDTAITLKNNSALYVDQTVLAVGVRGYIFLPFFALHSLLRMTQLTEYHLSFLAYVLRSVTVAAELRCENQRRISAPHVLMWANGSALDTSILWVNLSEAIAGPCVLTLRVTSAEKAAGDGVVPFFSWPYSYLRIPASLSPSSFFENSTTLTYLLQTPSSAFTVPEKHNVLSELSSFLMAAFIVLLSLVLGFFHAVSNHAPTLDLLPWRRYERELAKTLSDDVEACEPTQH